MTVHKAKGLEFDVVFLPELNEGEFPVSNMGGRKYWHVLGGTFEENREKYQGGVDEERKLIFQVKKWHSWSQYGLMGRHCETRVQDYIYLSDTKARYAKLQSGMVCPDSGNRCPDPAGYGAYETGSGPGGKEDL